MSEQADDDGYPTPEALHRLKNFQGTARELIHYVMSIWWPNDSIDAPETLGRIGPTLGGHYIWFWQLHTWGWSGNEEIIETLQQTYFWFRFWQQTTRGGHYAFHVPEPDFHHVDFLGYLAGPA